MPTPKKALSAFLPLVLWAGLIFWLSSQSQLPGLEAPWWDFALKKLAHMTVFGVFYWLAYRAIRMVTSPKASTKHLWLPILMTLAYALTDEIHQMYTPGRHPSISDIGFDCIGMLVAFLRRYGYI